MVVRCIGSIYQIMAQSIYIRIRGYTHCHRLLHYAMAFFR